MFAKLLKHDIFAMFKYWWIVAVSTILFSVIGSFCISIVTVSYTTHYSIQRIASILLIFSAIAIFISPMLIAVLMFRRFNKNFFSDEGYLTFTLPVNQSALLSSKLLTAIIFTILSIKVFELDVAIVFSYDLEELIDIRTLFLDIIAEYYSSFSIAIGTILLNITIIVAIATSIAFIFLCITLANILVRKRKLLLGIGIFYAVVIVGSIIIRTIFTSGALDLLINTDHSDEIAYALVMFGILAITTLVGSGIYLLNLYLLDKKLNLE